MPRNHTIKDVAESTGLSPSTIRMWQHRHDFPGSDRTESGYRLFSDEDIAQIKAVLAYRERGLSVPAAIDRVVSSDAPAEPSIYAAVATSDGAPKPQILRKSTLHALSRAMEHEAIAQGSSPICFGAFQHEGFYRPVEQRYKQIARRSDATVVFADFANVTDNGPGKPVEIPIEQKDALGNEWCVIIDSPSYCATLLAWEVPGEDGRGGPRDSERRFESLWTVEPHIVRRASEVATRLVASKDEKLGDQLKEMLSDRPIGGIEPAQALTNLTNRIVKYVEAS
jgi:DICT domain-containing protein